MPVRRLLAVALVAASALAAAAAVAGNRALTAAGPDLGQLEGFEFEVNCRFSHRAPDDPIVFPGKPELSHDHTFFGNVGTDAFSTPDGLRGRRTTCAHADDTAAYWAPTLIVQGKGVEPLLGTATYSRRAVAKVRPFPPGLQIVAGDAYATSPQPLSVTWWDCGELSDVGRSSSIPTCGAGARSLHLHVRFPDCWDGRRVDSADHKAHMAYSSRGACPGTHPVAVPSIELVVQYPVAGGAGAELSSRGQFSGHADFVNAWNQAGLARRVNVCLNALRLCGRAP